MHVACVQEYSARVQCSACNRHCCCAGFLEHVLGGWSYAAGAHAHDAGFDAFMTASAFANLLTLLPEPQDPISAAAPILVPTPPLHPACALCNGLVEPKDTHSQTNKQPTNRICANLKGALRLNMSLESFALM